MEGTYRIAGHRFTVCSLYQAVHTLCRDYREEGDPEFTLTTTPADIDYEAERSAREDILEGRAPQPYPADYLETLAVYRKLAQRLLREDILLFHGSVVEVDGQAYLFTACSGTGKTTHTRLWLKNIPGASVVNGDKPLLRFTEEGVWACGTPWQGKENYGRNAMVPLRALCVLERDTTNHIAPVSMREVLPILYQQSYHPADAESMQQLLALIGRLGGTVPLYRLGCNMENEAALIAYQGMCP